HAHHLALLDAEGHVPERPDRLGRRQVLPAEHAVDAVADRVSQRVVSGLQLPEAILLREALDLDHRPCRSRDRHQIVSAKRGSKPRKTVSPTRKSSPAMATLSANWPACGGGVPTSAQRKPVITPVIGFSDRIHCHFSFSASIG